jgi:carboxymethylenebutenolidase
MKSQTLTLKTPDGDCDTRISYPDEAGTYPAVLLYMDAFGPRPYLYEFAETLAGHGYYVVLPNLFYRVRPAPVIDLPFPLTPAVMPQARAQLLPLFERYEPEFGLRDTAFLLDFLREQKQVRPGPIGVTGYCMGGGLALRAAARFPHRIAAAASFHGGNLASDAPDSPHRLADRIRAEVYVAHADQDRHMPPEQMERLNAALEKANVRFEAETYLGAAHGFTMADLPAYQADALKKHWTKLLALFERTLHP